MLHYILINRDIFQACTFLENLVRWKAKFPEIKVYFLGINGDSQYDTFVAVFWVRFLAAKLPSIQTFDV